MAEEPRPANQQVEKPSDKPRVLGARPGSPRILEPVEESAEQLAEVARQSSSDARPQPGRAANDAAKNPSSRNGTNAESADVLMDLLQSSRLALDGMLAKTHEIHEESWRAMQSLFEDLHKKLSEEHKTRAESFVKEVDERGRYQTTALLDKIDVEAESRLTARLDRMLDKAHEAGGKSLDQLEEKVAASRKALNEFTNIATQELQRQKTICLAEVQTEAQKRLGIMKIEQSNYFENMAKKTADSLSEQFAKRTSVAAEAFQKRLQTASEEIFGELEKKVAGMTEAAVARISNEAQAIIARETSTNLIQALRKQLDHLANSLNGR
jgi:hypothetical protein